MKTRELFGFPCPECGQGTVRSTRILNYKTKIRGYPFVVDEALVGVCDRCGSESFAPEETKRWEELFYRSLEARHAFLSPQEIMELRTALGLSMEDFARLIGCTRQSISAWEKPGRSVSPSRMADLLMKLLREALRVGSVDVLPFLLGEAQKWGIVIELRRPPTPSAQNGDMILRTKQVPAMAMAQESSALALAAATGEEGGELVAVESVDGKRVGILNYDYERAALILTITSELPPWQVVDVEIETREGQHVPGRQVSFQEPCLVLLENTRLREKDVVQITLKAEPRAAGG
jgi:putative zinc finger/helix-turn-helix YgiT family protein